MSRKRKQPFIKRLNYKYATLALAAIVAILLMAELTDTTHFFHKAPVPAVIPVINSVASSPVKSPSDNGQSPTSVNPKDRDGSTKANGGAEKEFLPLYA